MATPAPKGFAVAKAPAIKPVPAPTAEPPKKPVRVKSRGIKKSVPEPITPAPGPDPDTTIANPVKPTTAIANSLLNSAPFDATGPLEPISDSVIMLQHVTKAMSTGEDIGKCKTDLIRIISHQPEKADVYQGILNQIEQERTTDAVVMRAQVERELKRLANQGKLTASDCITIWQMCNRTIAENRASAAKNTKSVDTVTIVEKVDLQKLQAERTIHQKWEGTTPQGRQIIRMKLFDLKRQVSASLQAKEAESVIDIK